MWLKQFRERKGPERGVAGWFTASQNGGCDPLQKKKKDIVFIFQKENLSGRAFVRPLLICATTDRSGGWCRFLLPPKGCASATSKDGQPVGQWPARWNLFQHFYLVSEKKTAIEGGASGTVLIAGPPTKRRLSQTDGFIDESPKNLNPPGSGFDHWPMAARRLFMSLFVFAQFACGANLGFIFEQKLYRN